MAEETKTPLEGLLESFYGGIGEVLPPRYDRQGKPVSSREYIELMRDKEYFRVGFYEDGIYTVSTVWLGFDIAFGRGREPLLFETMVFCKGKEAQIQWYQSEVEALAAHEHWVRKAKKGEL